VQVNKRRHSSSVRMAAPLETCTKEEQHSVIRFLTSEGVKLLKFIVELKLSMVMHVCHSSKCTSGVQNSQMV
jgi:hypothetical protein